MGRMARSPCSPRSMEMSLGRGPAVESSLWCKAHMAGGRVVSTLPGFLCRFKYQVSAGLPVLGASEDESPSDEEEEEEQADAGADEHPAVAGSMSP